MSDTTGRLLAVLSVLQSGGTWTGPQLADRLGVTVRTVRRDVERLRELGYPVDSDTGVAGGYRFGVGGTRLPPVMLDDEEAVALAVCVRSAAASAAAGAGEVAVRALAKLEQLLPTRLRPQLDALTSATASLPQLAPNVDSGLLVSLSRACRERDILEVHYEDSRGRPTQRRIEPVRLVSTGRRWYLVAFDLGPDDWRTFRADRIAEATVTGHRFTARGGPDPVELVHRAITTAPYRHRARVELAAPAPELAERIPPTVGVVEAIDDNTSVLTLGADDLDLLVVHLGVLGVPFRILEPPELANRVAQVAAHLASNAR